MSCAKGSMRVKGGSVRGRSATLARPLFTSPICCCFESPGYKVIHARQMHVFNGALLQQMGISFY